MGSSQEIILQPLGWLHVLVYSNFNVLLKSAKSPFIFLFLSWREKTVVHTFYDAYFIPERSTFNLFVVHLTKNANEGKKTIYVKQLCN